MIIANNRLQLARDSSSALAALRAADQQLQQLAMPKFLPVRRELAREISALESNEKLDVSGITLRLATQADNVDRLPLALDIRLREIEKAKLPVKESDAQVASADGNWRQTAHSLWQDILSLVRIRDDVGFFQAVRGVLAKNTPSDQKTDEELDHAIRQIVSKAVTSGEVIDIFTAAGLKKPDISILSDEFLAEVRDMPQKNLAVELLRKLLAGEVRLRSRRNVVQARSFSEMLEQSLRRYQNRAIETAQVIEELLGLAKQMREAQARGEALGLTHDEVAFYDALEANDSAVKVLGEPTLKTIARELVKTVKSSVTIDWTVRENVRAQLRVIVKRILRKYGYPPDKQEKATQTVLEQAALLSEAWLAA